MSWFVFALAAAIFFGAGQVFIKKGYSHFSPLWSAIIDSIFTLLIYIPLAFILGVNFTFSFLQVFFVFLVATLYIFFYYAIEKAQVSISGTIFASYPVVTIILAYLFLQERITFVQFVLIGLILVGGILLSYTPKGLKEIGKNFKKNWIAWAIFGSVSTGIGDFLAKATLNTLDINTYVLLFGLTFPISTLIFWLFDKGGRKLPKKIKFHELKWTLLGTLMLSLGVLSISYAFAYGTASLVSVISTAYIAITASLAYFFLGEKITRRQIIGILIIFVGLLFIGV